MLNPKLKSTLYSDSKLCLAMLFNMDHQQFWNEFNYNTKLTKKQNATNSSQI